MFNLHPDTKIYKIIKPIVVVVFWLKPFRIEGSNLYCSNPPVTKSVLLVILLRLALSVINISSTAHDLPIKASIRKAVGCFSITFQFGIITIFILCT